MAALLSKGRNLLALNLTHRAHAHATCPGKIQFKFFHPLQTRLCCSKSTTNHSDALKRISQYTVSFNIGQLRCRAALSDALRIREPDSARHASFVNCFQSSYFRRSLTVQSQKEERSLKIYTVPNAICVFRIAASPYIGYLVMDGRYETALYCFVLAGISDGESCLQLT
jgi:hypothetical protein